MVEMHCGYCGAKWAQAFPDHPPTVGDLVSLRVVCPYCSALAGFRAAKEARPLPYHPAPADEWSKPVKGADGRWGCESFANQSRAVDVSDEGMVRVYADHDEACYAPRDVVLRLLAAEASDRLGWVWEVVRFEPRVHPRPDHRRTLLHARVTLPAGATEMLWWAEWDGDRVIRQAGFEEVVPDTPDELLASLHGNFLLEEAMRKADLAEIEAENRAEREREYGAVEESNRRFEEEGP